MKLSLEALKVNTYANQVNNQELTEVKGGSPGSIFDMLLQGLFPELGSPPPPPPKPKPVVIDSTTLGN